VDGYDIEGSCFLCGTIKRSLKLRRRKDNNREDGAKTNISFSGTTLFFFPLSPSLFLLLRQEK
jgi:hypothetical protein